QAGQAGQAQPVETHPTGNGAAVAVSDAVPGRSAPTATAASDPSVAPVAVLSAPAEPASVALPTASVAPTPTRPVDAIQTVPLWADDEAEEPASGIEPDSGSGQGRVLTLAGAGLAAVAELYLQFGDPTNRTKTIGLGMLLAGAILFALGAAEGLL